MNDNTVNLLILECKTMFNDIDNVIQDITNSTISYIDEEDNNMRCSFSVDLTKIFQLESFLDALRVLHPKMRYSITIYEASKKWPCSIRINKRGKKITTRQQTKIFAFN